MPWRGPPKADFDTDETYRWPFWRVGLDEADLFGNLHERFNTVPMFIQDADAFHRDVKEVALCASSKQDFYDRMQQRRDFRLDELNAFARQLWQSPLWDFYPFDEEQRFAHFRLTRCASLDCLVAFIASFLGPNKHGKLVSDNDLSSDTLVRKYQRYPPGQTETPNPAPESQLPPDPTATSSSQRTPHQAHRAGRSKKRRQPAKVPEDVKDNQIKQQHAEDLAGGHVTPRIKRQRTETNEPDAQSDSQHKDAVDSSLDNRKHARGKRRRTEEVDSQEETTSITSMQRRASGRPRTPKRQESHDKSKGAVTKPRKLNGLASDLKPDPRSLRRSSRRVK